MTTPVNDADIVAQFGERIAPAAAADGRGEVKAVRLGFTKFLIKFATVGGRVAFGPAVKSIWFFDASAAAGSRWKDLLDESARGLIDGGSTTGTGTVLDDWAVADFLYVQTNAKAGGYRFEFASPNDNASTLTAAYSKSDGTFAATAITDGTNSVADTLKVETGEVTIDTVPTDWVSLALQNLGITDLDAPTTKGYWFRFDVSAVLDADFEIDLLVAMTEDFGEGVTSGESGFYDADTNLSENISSTQVSCIETGMQTGAAGVADLSWFRYGMR